METVKIEVPNFDGYEAYFGIPEFHDFVLDGSGKKLIMAEGFYKSPQICYRKIKPKRVVLELKGKDMIADVGEYFRLPDGTFMKEVEEYRHSRHREVWRVVEEQS